MIRAGKETSSWWERAAALPMIVLFVIGLAYLAAPLPDLGPPPTPSVGFEEEVAALSPRSGN